MKVMRDQQPDYGLGCTLPHLASLYKGEEKDSHYPWFPSFACHCLSW